VQIDADAHRSSDNAVLNTIRLAVEVSQEFEACSTVLILSPSPCPATQNMLHIEPSAPKASLPSPTTTGTTATTTITATVIATTSR